MNRRAAIMIAYVSCTVSARGFTQDVPSIDPVVDEPTTPTSPDSVNTVYLDALVLIPLGVKGLTGLILGAYSPEGEVGVVVGDITFNFLPWIGVGTAYLLTARAGGPEEHTLRGHLDLFYKTEHYKLDLRNSIDRRIDTSQTSGRTRFRPRARITYYGANWVAAYAYIEPFYNFNENEVSSVNFGIGTYAQINSYVWVNGLYIRIQNTSTGPDVNLVSTGVVLLF